MNEPRILIVDDQPRIGQSLCRILGMPEGGGYSTESCESGEEAAERLAAAHFDLVITDLRMSGMTGLELLLHARARDPNLPCILMTAYDSPKAQAETRRLAAEYLVKPLNPRELVETVARLLPLRSAAPEPSIRNSAPALTRRCEQLRRDVGAAHVILVDQSGQIVAESGERGELETEKLLPLLTSTLTAANAAAGWLHEPEAVQLALHQGKQQDIYTARINDKTLLCTMLGRRPGATSPVGMVWLSLRRAILDFRALLADSPGRHLSGDPLPAGEITVAHPSAFATSPARAPRGPVEAERPRLSPARPRRPSHGISRPQPPALQTPEEKPGGPTRPSAPQPETPSMPPSSAPPSRMESIADGSSESEMPPRWWLHESAEEQPRLSLEQAAALGLIDLKQLGLGGEGER